MRLENYTQKKILIIEDEPALADLLAYSLKKEGYMVDIAGEGIEGINMVEKTVPDLILLDLMLPDINGFDVCRKLVDHIPVIMITAKSDIVDKVLGLEIGAYDYITKPFDIREVIARVKSVLKRAGKYIKQENQNIMDAILVDNNIAIYKHERAVEYHGQIVDLTPKEFDLLVILAENKGIVFTRSELLDKVWGYEYAGGTRTVDIHVRRLRRKLGTDAIQTVFGVGYRIAK